MFLERSMLACWKKHNRPLFPAAFAELVEACETEIPYRATDDPIGSGQGLSKVSAKKLKWGGHPARQRARRPLH
jgi:hypothetical protein